MKDLIDELRNLARQDSWASEPMRNAADALESQAREIAELRKIISESATACGAAVSPECSLAFMAMLPKEISAVITALKAQPSGVVSMLRDALELWLSDYDEVASNPDFEPFPHVANRVARTRAALDSFARLNQPASAVWMMPTVKQLEQALESVPSFHDLSAELIAPAMLEHLREVISAGEYGDAYQGARQDLLIWKRRALEAETKVREQDQVIENLGNALNAESGPTFMGEPVMPASGGDETNYPSCDYCAARINYHPWHGSGMFNGVESRHIHACNDCRHKLPNSNASSPGDERAAFDTWFARDVWNEGCHGNPDILKRQLWPCWQARAALSANHSEQVRQAAKFTLGDRVRKTKGSQWRGTVVGTYSTVLTPEGYAVESSTELGSVQIYPAAALEACE